LHSAAAPVSYNQGLFEYMFGAGDTLLGTYTGDLTFNSPGLFDNRQIFVVTGGTGRFDGATGSFLGVGTVDFRGATPSAQLEFSGVLDAPAIPEPATWALMIIGFGGVGCGIRRRAAAAPRPRPRPREPRSNQTKTEGVVAWSSQR
jgi:hypothetical protein